MKQQHYMKRCSLHWVGTFSSEKLEFKIKKVTLLMKKYSILFSKLMSVIFNENTQANKTTKPDFSVGSHTKEKNCFGTNSLQSWALCRFLWFYKVFNRSQQNITLKSTSNNCVQLYKELPKLIMLQILFA